MVHVIHDSGQNTAAAAGRRSHNDMLVSVFLTDRICIGRNESVHRDVGVFIVAAFFKQELCLPCDAQTAGQDSLRLQTTLNGVLHG